jgi:hypothetical protein
MVNNLLYAWFIIILTLIVINVLIRIYKFYKRNYFYSVVVETFINVDGSNFINYFKFQNIKTNPLIKWKSKNNYIKMLDAVLCLINNNYNLLNKYHNRNLCIIICDFNIKTGLYSAMSDPYFINFNDLNTELSGDKLYNLIKWNDFACGLNNLNDIVIIIKTY